MNPSDASYGAVLRGLYAITPQLDDETLLLALTGKLLNGGVRMLQYRDKSGRTPRQREALAARLLDCCREHGARLIINDDLALALATGADGVHLGVGDGDLAVARRALGEGKLLGATCHADPARARRAAEAGADYVAFGAFFPSPTKPEAELAPLEVLSSFRAGGFDRAAPAICAIGGITLENAPELLRAGASLLAVSSDLFLAARPEARAAAYQSLFNP
ncbi:MAG: thiamine phosphate synthase [Betaproteobacteria bacterium]|nr:thiamine phosphate synthase [Betaproteobacteria bacterium]